MRKLIFGVLICASLALFIGYGAAFLGRWGLRGLMVAVIFGALLAVAALAAAGGLSGRWPRLSAALGYGLMVGWAVLSLLDTFKNDWIRDLLMLQAATGAIGLIACALPRREW
ncbi:hypothetical protein [Terrarubrum flagellatum]|uniref:hypothetical protein n=1 Tax=Terrirubrum flagellatum TaxID=2895980 RepID=UPI003144D725